MRIIYFEDLNEGDVLQGSAVEVDHDEMLNYNRRNDPWPIHVDPEAAAKSPFGGLIASGGYTITLMYRSLISAYNSPERRWAFLSGFDWHVKFQAPVRPGDLLTAQITILTKRLSSKGGRGIITTTNEIFNQDGKVVMSIGVACLLATQPDTA